MPKKANDKDKVFHSMYEKLNKKQREVVDTIEGPVMVIAGPGTGKTTILTLRIANILRTTDTPPSGILAITFTDAGVKAMRMKLREVIGARADQVRIHTFHGFANSIINEYQDHFVHLSNTRMMTDIDGEEMIRKILNDDINKFQLLRPLGNTDFYIYPIREAISDLKNDAVTPSMVRAWAKEQMEKIKNDEDNIATRGINKGQLKADAIKKIEKCEKTLILADVYEEYEKRKQEDKLTDYDDLILQLLHAFRNDELLLRIIQENFLYILIDEHQDTNDSQNLLISLIADYFEVPNVFIVGDEKQAIYRFQGASVHNFLHFRSEWRNMKIISLEDNYRSHQSILDASFGMIENNYGEDELKELRVKLKSGLKGNKVRPIDIINGTNTNSIEEYLIERLEEHNENQDTVAIITKTNRDLENIIRLLESRNIPVSSLRNVNIFNHPISSIFFDLSRFLINPSDVESLSKTIVAGLWDLSFDDSILALKALREGKDNISKLLPKINSIRGRIMSDDIIGFLIYLAQESGLINLLMRDPAYMEIWRGIISLSQSLIREYKISSIIELLAKLISYKDSSETKTVKVSIGTNDLSIQAMTAHGSKGLEYDYVYIMYANEERWMGRERAKYFTLPEMVKKDSEDSIKDARRLFYVAITRAKRHVCILSANEEIGGRQMTPLRFIEELDSNHVNRIEIKDDFKTQAVLNSDKKEFASKNKFNRKLLDYAKNLITEKGISVTALNHYLNCPSEFLVKSILKLPEAKAPLAEKGTALHLAFKEVWSYKNSGKKINAKIIEDIMLDSVKRYMNESSLARNDKKVVLNDLVEIIPAISVSMLTHFLSEGKIYSETWSEFSFGNGERNIPIHGKLDVVIDNGKEVIVYDYKTKKKMTLAEIKGETKNSDGNYFRQLVFYHLLIQNDSRFAGRKIVPTLAFVVPDNNDNCTMVHVDVSDEDISKLKNEISNLIKSIYSDNLRDKQCHECEWCQMLVNF